MPRFEQEYYLWVILDEGWGELAEIWSSLVFGLAQRNVSYSLWRSIWLVRDGRPRFRGAPPGNLV